MIAAFFAILTVALLLLACWVESGGRSNRDSGEEE